MKLRVISDHGSTEFVVADEVTPELVRSTVESLDWNQFHQVVLEQSNGNWFEAGGSLDPSDGFSLMYDEAGQQVIIEVPPANVETLVVALLHYLSGDEKWKESPPPVLGSNGDVSQLSPRWKTAAIVGFCWIAAGIVSAFSGFWFGGIFNYVDRIEYGCSEPKIVQDIWIRPEIKSHSYGLTLPFLYSFESSGPPFSVGLTVLDYDNSSRCRTLVIEELFATVDGKRISMLENGDHISVPFEKYLNGSANVIADCFLRLPDTMPAEEHRPIRIEAKIAIHTDDQVISESVSGKLRPYRSQGSFWIWEALSPD